MITLDLDQLGKVLGLSLLHFSWLAGVVFLLYCLISACFFRATSQIKYTISVAVMVLMVGCLPATFIFMLFESSQSYTELSNPEIEDAAFAPQLFAVTSSFDKRARPPTISNDTALAWHEFLRIRNSSIGPQQSGLNMLNLLAIAYLFGVCLMVSRIVLGYYSCQRLCRNSIQVHSCLSQWIAQMASALGIKTVPVIAICNQVCAPVVVGLIRPAILIPGWILSGLSTDEMELILVHELAHLKRNDLLVNLLQRLAQSLLFFHPVIWIVSRQINEQREASCDDFVVGNKGDSVAYASALLRVAEIGFAKHKKAQSRLLALSSTGISHSQLRRRVMRLLNRPTVGWESIKPRCLSISFCAITATVVAIWLVSHHVKHQEPETTLAPSSIWVYDSGSNLTDQLATKGIRSLKLSRQKPVELKMEIMTNQEDILFGQIQYGTQQSLPIFVAVEESGESVNFYVDKNRDRTLTMSERIVTEHRKAIVEFDAQVALGDKGIANLPRKLLIWFQPLGTRLNLVTQGYVEGFCKLANENICVRRIDGNGNGVFTDSADQVAFDLNGDSLFDESSETFALTSMLELNGIKYALFSDFAGQELQLKPVENFGEIEFALDLQPGATMDSIDGTLVDENGFAFAIKSTEQTITVPPGKYAVNNLTLVMRNEEVVEPWVFQFRRGSIVREVDVFDVAVGNRAVKNLVANLKFGYSLNQATSFRDDAAITLAPFLQTDDGLVLTDLRRSEVADNFDSEHVSARIILKSPSGMTIAQDHCGFF